MKFEEFSHLGEAQVWARTGKKVTRKFRCQSGGRKGRIVSSMAQCYAAPDPKKRAQMKKTRARLGKKMARKSRKTKRTNPASKIITALNKARK